MNDSPHVPGFTSTGSKRPEALFGAGAGPSVPVLMSRASGCRVWDAKGREYLDFLMGLGAVALGYAHPDVTRAATDAIAAGVVGPLPPTDEEALAAELCERMPWMERVRFLKTGAEAVAAAVRLARVVTGREFVLSCGYHGWLDWSQGAGAEGVPREVRALRAELPFNDVERTREQIRAAGPQLAAVVVEPLVVSEARREWLETLRAESTRAGAVLIYDEIKTAFRVAVGGVAEKSGIHPDLTVLGKALANGFPLAAVGGNREVMEAVTRTWISSTLATEMVSLAAARAVLGVFARENVCAHLHRVGTRLLHGLHELQRRHAGLVTSVAGVAEMSFLHYDSDDVSRAVAIGCAERGLLFKRTAYNFVSLAHYDGAVDRALDVLGEVLGGIERRGPGKSL